MPSVNDFRAMLFRPRATACPRTPGRTSPTWPWRTNNGRGAIAASFASGSDPESGRDLCCCNLELGNARGSFVARARARRALPGVAGPASEATQPVWSCQSRRKKLISVTYSDLAWEPQRRPWFCSGTVTARNAQLRQHLHDDVFFVSKISGVFFHALNSVFDSLTQRDTDLGEGDVMKWFSAEYFSPEDGAWTRAELPPGLPNDTNTPSRAATRRSRTSVPSTQ